MLLQDLPSWAYILIGIVDVIAFIAYSASSDSVSRLLEKRSKSN